MVVTMTLAMCFVFAMARDLAVFLVISVACSLAVLLALDFFAVRVFAALTMVALGLFLAMIALSDCVIDRNGRKRQEPYDAERQGSEPERCRVGSWGRAHLS
jgi:hypothetical protein